MNKRHVLVNVCENLRKIMKCFKLVIFRTLEVCIHVGTMFILVIVPTEHMSSFLFSLTYM